MHAEENASTVLGNVCGIPAGRKPRLRARFLQPRRQASQRRQPKVWSS